MTRHEAYKSVSTIRKVKPDTGEITGSNQLTIYFLYENRDKEMFLRDIGKFWYSSRKKGT